MSNKAIKKLRKKIYRDNFLKYEYDSKCDPSVDWGMDTVADYYDKYGTRYPTGDKNCYKKPARDYKNK